MLLGLQLSGVERPCHAQLVGGDGGVSSGQQLVDRHREALLHRCLVEVTATANFKILPKATGISNIVPGKKSFSLQWKKQATQTNGYIIQYSTDSTFKKDAKTKKITNVNTTKATISGLSGNRTYYVRICTFKLVNGKTYSSAWSKSKTVKTKN